MAKETNEQVRKQLSELFHSQKLATLATQKDGQPYASLVAFYSSDDLKHIYFVTPWTTRKFAYLTANSRVAVMINSSTNRPSDFHRAVSVTALGEAIEVDSPEKDLILGRYLEKHPHLDEFAQSPTCALVQVTVRSYYMVKKFQNVTELHLEK